MARNRQAFSRLKAAINTTGFVAATGTPAGNYLAWLRNEREKGTPKALRVTTENKGRLRLGLVPFSSGNAPIVEATTLRETGYITTHSAVSITTGVKAGTAPAEAARFGTAKITAIEMGAISPNAVTRENAGFYSAQIVFRAMTKDAAAARNVVSGITGRSYSYREASVATVPFGKAVGTDNVSTRYAILAAKPDPDSGTISLSTSLNNEVLRGQRSSGVID